MLGLGVGGVFSTGAEGAAGTGAAVDGVGALPPVIGASPNTSCTVRTTSSMPTCDFTR